MWRWSVFPVFTGDDLWGDGNRVASLWSAIHGSGGTLVSIKTPGIVQLEDIRLFFILLNFSMEVQLPRHKEDLPK